MLRVDAMKRNLYMQPPNNRRICYAIDCELLCQQGCQCASLHLRPGMATWNPLPVSATLTYAYMHAVTNHLCKAQADTRIHAQVHTNKCKWTQKCLMLDCGSSGNLVQARLQQTTHCLHHAVLGCGLYSHSNFRMLHCRHIVILSPQVLPMPKVSVHESAQTCRT